MMLAILSCNQGPDSTAVKTPENEASQPAGGQEKVKDDESAKDVVKVALASKDHTTLVSALQAADLVTSLSNAGPFTVFAPTNEAFAKLPQGVLDGLLKKERREDLRNILQYHVTLSALKEDQFHDGQVLGMVNGDNVTLSVKDGKIILNNTVHVLQSVAASNGMVYITDGVLLPPAAK